jgi:DnaK suppressor protein
MPKKQTMKAKQTMKVNKKTKTEKRSKPTVTKTKIKTKPITKTKAARKKLAGKATKITAMDKKLHEIKKKLLSQKKELLIGAIEALNELPGETVFSDLGDQATAEIDRNFMLRLKGRERKLLKKIEEAIERINQGVFGICEKCGEDINIKRLEARPVTTMCIECKTLQEEEEKLRER